LDAPRRVVVFVGVVALVGLLVAVYGPFSWSRGYGLDYLRSAAVEVAEAIDAGRSVRLPVGFVSGRKGVVVVVAKPGEENVTVRVWYNVLCVPAEAPAGVVRGRPDAAFVRFREAAVYFNGSWLVVDPKPLVEYYRKLEYGRTVHVVRITVFHVRGELERGSVLSLNGTSSRVYVRGYDYSGFVEVWVSGREALRIRVARDDVLELLVVSEEWVSG